MLRLEDAQLDFHSQIVEKMVREDHPYRRIKGILDFEELLEPFHCLYSNKGAQGIALESGFKCLLLQFYEDHSDRQMENALKENVAMKWFCGFALMQATPDYSYFSKLRKRIGVV